MPSTDRKLELKAKTSVAQTGSQPFVYAKRLTVFGGKFRLVLLLERKTSKLIRQTHIQYEEAFYEPLLWNCLKFNRTTAFLS
jgi:hypothetical protein